MLKIAFGVVFFLFWFRATSQEIPVQSDNISEIVEQIASTSEEETDLTDLQAEITELLANPINLNTAGEEELRKISWLSEFQIQSLLDYRLQYGNFLSIYEISYIYGFDVNTAKNLAPFVKIEDNQYQISNPRKYNSTRSELLLRTQTLLETPAGYKSKSDSTETSNFYKGNKARYYAKYKIEKSGFSGGFTAEKDPGEEITGKGFDYYSGYLMTENKGIVKRAIVGDYGVCMGQGLILWSRYASSKGAETIEIRRKNQGIYKHSGTDENNFFRGAAVQIASKPFLITAFVSSKDRDASVSQDSLTENQISSFQVSGLHATESQLENRKNVNEKAFGSSIGFANKSLKINLNGLYHSWDIPVIKSDKTYKKFDFYGKENLNFSTDFLILLKGISLFGEAAISKNHALAFTGGSSVFISDRLTATFLFRQFERNHQSFYGKPFSENGSAQNETAFYTGIKWAAMRKMSISVYFDQYKFPWMTYSVSSPSSGYGAFVQADYSINLSTRMLVRYGYNQKQTDQNLTDSLPQLNSTAISSHKIRFEIRHNPNLYLTLKTRIDYVKYLSNNAPEEGIYAFQDLQYSLEKFPVTFTARLGVFDTKSYNSRLYAYENDVLYAFSVPAVYQQGMRSYFMVEYSPTRSLDVWVRLAQTYYTGEKNIGTALDEINGPAKSEIKIQLKWSF